MHDERDVRLVREHEIGRRGVVTIATGSDDVIVRGVDATVARIVEPSEDLDDLETRTGPGQFDVRLGGRGRFVIDVRIGSRSWGSRGGRTVRVDVPRTARVEVSTSAGDVDVEGVVGGVSVRAVSGDVSIRGTAGEVGAETASGDIGIEGVAAVGARVATVSGDVRLVAPDVLRASLSTVSGDVSIQGRPDPAGTHDIETTSGDVHLVLAGGATVGTRTVSGDVFASSPARRDEGRRGPIVIGDGAARVSVRTLSGDVSVAASPHAGAATATPGSPTTTILDVGVASLGRPSTPIPPARPMPPFVPISPVAPLPPVAPVAVPPPGDAPPAASVTSTSPGCDAPNDRPNPTLAVLEALARGQIDVAEAERRLAMADTADGAGEPTAAGDPAGAPGDPGAGEETTRG